MTHKAIIIGCEGAALTMEEKALFANHKPHGFILFQRNCESKDQVKKLVDELREAIDSENAPVLIDQEGGRVTRLKSPEWYEYPYLGDLTELYPKSAEDMLEATELHAALLAEQNRELGITVNCSPCLDVLSPECHEFIGKRSFGGNPETVGLLGAVTCQGHLSHGNTPVIKHIPGHGRSVVDSHFELPVTTTSLDELKAVDFAPFKEMASLGLDKKVWAMSAHMIYSAIDPDKPASVSKTVIEDIVRDYMGFEGVLIADDISMQALDGSIGERAAETLAAGNDLTLHCNGKMDEMIEALDATTALTEMAKTRLEKAEEARTARIAKGFDTEANRARFYDLMALRETA